MKAVFGLLVLAVIVAAFGGYVANIVELIHHHYSVIVTVIKVAGIFVPFVGAVAGWVS